MVKKNNRKLYENTGRIKSEEKKKLVVKREIEWKIKKE